MKRAAGRLPLEVLEPRFWTKVRVTGFCWDWMAYLSKDGYGQFWVGDAMVKSHRFAYELLVGQIPEGLVVDHLCRNRSCVNPDHLDLVTPVENTSRGARARRSAYCKNGHLRSPENTYIYPGGRRSCAPCLRQIQRDRRKRLRAAGEKVT